MRSAFDFTAYRPSWIGFDHFFDMLNNGQTDSGGFPPYDLEQNEENAYRLSIAVAGFSQDDIEIISKSNLLVVKGRRQDDDRRRYLYRGIASYEFERRFQLADHVLVTGAKLENGLLEIELKQEVPEEIKPRKIEISRDGNAKQLEGGRRSNGRTKTDRRKPESDDIVGKHQEPRFQARMVD